MSTVVLVERNGEACMAADTLTTCGSTQIPARYLESHEKILQIGETLIGIVGWSVSACVLESVFDGELELPEVRTERELFEFSRRLHRKLKEDYFLRTEENATAWESSQLTLLLLNRFGLFGLFSNRTVERYRRFTAVGSGSDYAIGAMHAAYELGASCEEIARLGVEAGTEFDDASAAPITIKRMKLES